MLYRVLISVRLTYDATLAELTSLEEMMRSMMDDGQIHPDVIAKLWQVYSSCTHPSNHTRIVVEFFFGWQVPINPFRSLNDEEQLSSLECWHWLGGAL
jgi:hypothetical protein